MLCSTYFTKDLIFELGTKGAQISPLMTVRLPICYLPLAACHFKMQNGEIKLCAGVGKESPNVHQGGPCLYVCVCVLSHSCFHAWDYIPTGMGHTDLRDVQYGKIRVEYPTAYYRIRHMTHPCKPMKSEVEGAALPAPCVCWPWTISAAILSLSLMLTALSWSRVCVTLFSVYMLHATPLSSFYAGRSVKIKSMTKRVTLLSVCYMLHFSVPYVLSSYAGRSVKINVMVVRVTLLSVCYPLSLLCAGCCIIIVHVFVWCVC